MPNTPSVTRSNGSVRLNGYTLSPSEAQALASQLTSAASFGPIPGTLTVTAPVSKKRGNNVLHGVTQISVLSNGRVMCFTRDGGQPKYADGSQHKSFKPVVRATKGPRRGQLCTMSVVAAQ